MAAPSIVVVGSVNMDLVMKAAYVPKPGENVFAESFEKFPGGKGANQAVAASRLGASVSLVARVGDDAFGDELVGTIEMAGVDCTHVMRVVDTPTGTALIIVDDAGENAIVVARGANVALSADDLDAVEDMIADADVVLLQLEIPVATVAQAVCLANKHGVRTVLDAGPPCRAFSDALYGVDILSPNMAEAADILGRPVRDLSEAEQAARELACKGPKAVVVKLGAHGALLAVGSDCRRFPAVKVNPVDTTGAGDAFTAALAVFVAEGRSVEESVALANCAGAAAVMTPGAQPSMPTRTAVEVVAGKPAAH